MSLFGTILSSIVCFLTTREGWLSRDLLSREIALNDDLTPWSSHQVTPTIPRYWDESRAARDSSHRVKNGRLGAKGHDGRRPSSVSMLDRSFSNRQQREGFLRPDCIQRFQA